MPILTNAGFSAAAPIISGFLYSLNDEDRTDFKANELHDVDAGEVEPKIATSNGIAMHKCMVTIGAREFLIYAWNVGEAQGVARNKSLERIRPSTLFYGEVVIFVKGATARVPFLKYPQYVPKAVLEEAVGGYITSSMNAQDAGREPPTRLKLNII